MDENKLANILQEPNKFQVSHRTEEEHEIVFEEAEKNMIEPCSKTQMKTMIQKINITY